MKSTHAILGGAAALVVTFGLVGEAHAGHASGAVVRPSPPEGASAIDAADVERVAGGVLALALAGLSGALRRRKMLDARPPAPPTAALLRH
jgi:hypothetical protein